MREEKMVFMLDIVYLLAESLLGILEVGVGGRFATKIFAVKSKSTTFNLN